eukprot:361960-Chlamydomonas_euryale.AAC.3
MVPTQGHMGANRSLIHSLHSRSRSETSSGTCAGRRCRKSAVVVWCGGGVAGKMQAVEGRRERRGRLCRHVLLEGGHCYGSAEVWGLRQKYLLFAADTTAVCGDMVFAADTAAACGRHICCLQLIKQLLAAGISAVCSGYNCCLRQYGVCS